MRHGRTGKYIRRIGGGRRYDLRGEVKTECMEGRGTRTGIRAGWPEGGVKRMMRGVKRWRDVRGEWKKRKEVTEEGWDVWVVG